MGDPVFQFHLDDQSVCAKGVLLPRRIRKDETEERDDKKGGWMRKVDVRWRKIQKENARKEECTPIP